MSEQPGPAGGGPAGSDDDAAVAMAAALHRQLDVFIGTITSANFRAVVLAKDPATHGWSVFHAVCSRRFLGGLRFLLLKLRAQPYAIAREVLLSPDAEGSTPAHVAAASGSAAAVAMLLEEADHYGLADELLAAQDTHDRTLTHLMPAAAAVLARRGAALEDVSVDVALSATRSPPEAASHSPHRPSAVHSDNHGTDRSHHSPGPLHTESILEEVRRQRDTTRAQRRDLATDSPPSDRPPISRSPDPPRRVPHLCHACEQSRGAAGAHPAVLRCARCREAGQPSDLCETCWHAEHSPVAKRDHASRPIDVTDPLLGMPALRLGLQGPVQTQLDSLATVQHHILTLVRQLEGSIRDSGLHSGSASSTPRGDHSPRSCASQTEPSKPAPPTAAAHSPFDASTLMHLVVVAGESGQRHLLERDHAAGLLRIVAHERNCLHRLLLHGATGHTSGRGTLLAGHGAPPTNRATSPDDELGRSVVFVHGEKHVAGADLSLLVQWRGPAHREEWLPLADVAHFAVVQAYMGRYEGLVEDSFEMTALRGGSPLGATEREALASELALLHGQRAGSVNSRNESRSSPGGVRLFRGFGSQRKLLTRDLQGGQTPHSAATPGRSGRLSRELPPRRAHQHVALPAASGMLPEEYQEALITDFEDVLPRPPHLAGLSPTQLLAVLEAEERNAMSYEFNDSNETTPRRGASASASELHSPHQLPRQPSDMALAATPLSPDGQEDALAAQLRELEAQHAAIRRAREQMQQRLAHKKDSTETTPERERERADGTGPAPTEGTHPVPQVPPSSVAAASPPDAFSELLTTELGSVEHALGAWERPPVPALLMTAGIASRNGVHTTDTFATHLSSGSSPHHGMLSASCSTQPPAPGGNTPRSAGASTTSHPSPRPRADTITEPPPALSATPPGQAMAIPAAPTRSPKLPAIGPQQRPPPLAAPYPQKDARDALPFLGSSDGPRIAGKLYAPDPAHPPRIPPPDPRKFARSLPAGSAVPPALKGSSQSPTTPGKDKRRVHYDREYDGGSPAPDREDDAALPPLPRGGPRPKSRPTFIAPLD